MSDLSALGQAALEYAAQGLAVFPLVPRDKRPLTTQGFLDATTDAEQVRRWWTTSPAANIGAVPASVGCVALDIDTPQHIETAEALGLFAEPNHEVITGNGSHLWFKHDAPDATALAGIIARSGRGYVVMPPSVHPSGAVYASETTLTNARPLPERAALALVKGDAPAPAGARIAARAIGAKITPGDRHAALVTEAGRIAAHGLLDGGHTFLQGFNLIECDPPKPAEEVTKIWEYVITRESAKRAEKERRRGAVDLSALDPAPGDSRSAPDSDRFRVRSFAELLADPTLTRPPRFVIPGLVEEGCATLISGRPKEGKSTLISQIAADFSRGRPALDGTQVAPGRVLWIALDEPTRRLVQRLPSFDPDPDLFRVFERPREKFTPEWFAQLLEHEDPALVVVDTLSQWGLDNGVKINDGDLVNPFMKPIVHAIQSRPRCGGLFIFHAPHHANRAAGSFQWEATVDAALVLRRRITAIPKPGESPDDVADSGTEDGRRVLMGTTRWDGPMRLDLSFADHRYSLGAAPAPVIDRVRWFLKDTPPGPGATSAANIARQLGVRDLAVKDALRTLIDRGEAKYTGTGKHQHVTATPSMLFYVAEVDGKSNTPLGESHREEEETACETPETLALPGNTPAYESGKSNSERQAA